MPVHAKGLHSPVLLQAACRRPLQVARCLDRGAALAAPALYQQNMEQHGIAQRRALMGCEVAKEALVVSVSTPLVTLACSASDTDFSASTFKLCMPGMTSTLNGTLTAILLKLGSTRIAPMSAGESRTTGGGAAAARRAHASTSTASRIMIAIVT